MEQGKLGEALASSDALEKVWQKSCVFLQRSAGTGGLNSSVVIATLPHSPNQVSVHMRCLWSLAAVNVFAVSPLAPHWHVRRWQHSPHIRWAFPLMLCPPIILMQACLHSTPVLQRNKIGWGLEELREREIENEEERGTPLWQSIRISVKKLCQDLSYFVSFLHAKDLLVHSHCRTAWCDWRICHWACSRALENHLVGDHVSVCIRVWKKLLKRASSNKTRMTCQTVCILTESTLVIMV